VAAVLDSLHELGVRIAVDDFGTGYSALGYLRRLPVDFLKIDLSFVSGLGTPQGDPELVSGIIAMSHALGMQVVAEGVETVEQLTVLRDLGCDMIQGFLFARPIPVLDLETLLDAGLPSNDAETASVARARV
jgi:EAL domain-containing protein (putative c-di-GMP-specific phosphodiesterase class I)